MENKQLQIAKDTIAKKYGHNNWKHFTDMSASGFGGISEKMLDEISIEYHRLMSEWVSVDEISKEDKEIIDAWIIESGKIAMALFMTIGLKNGIEATMVNDYNGEYYKLSFIKLPQPPK
jgi:predicted Zn-dependent protease with MMP-like domain